MNYSTLWIERYFYRERLVELELGLIELVFNWEWWGLLLGLLGVAWEWLSVGVCWLWAGVWEIIDSLVMVVIVRFIVHIKFFLVKT